MTKALLVTGVIFIGGLECVALAGQSGPPPAVFTEAQAAAGRASYESVCVNCHTDSLGGRKGNGDANELPLVGSLSADWQKMVLGNLANGNIPPLAGEVFTKRWASRTTSELANRIQVAIGGFPPTEWNEKTKLNLAAYFLKVSGVPSGSQELTGDADTAVRIGDLQPISK